MDLRSARVWERKIGKREPPVSPCCPGEYNNQNNRRTMLLFVWGNVNFLPQLLGFDFAKALCVLQSQLY
jgi:hypothetical protein